MVGSGNTWLGLPTQREDYNRLLFARTSMEEGASDRGQARQTRGQRRLGVKKKPLG